MSEQQIQASAYVTLSAKRYQYGRVNDETGLKPVTGMTVSRVTQSRPSKLAPDEIAVRVKFVLPANIFDPIQPSAVITVPEDAVIRGDIIVEAEVAE